MKKVLLLALAVVLPLLFVTPQAQALSINDCMTQVQTLIDSVEGLVATNPKDTAKIQKELLKKLNQAMAYMEKGGVQNYYKAAKKVWDFDWKVRQYGWKGKISETDAENLDGGGLAAMDCIVDVYCPECNWDPY